jgi:protein-S-isoprenylcysteine O-methyltransferase Ste14
MKKLSLELRLLLIYVLSVIAISAVVITPAWTMVYWQGWLFLAFLFIPILLVGLYMLKFKRSLLEKRINAREKRKPQKLIQSVNTLLFIIAMVIPGFDHRFGWSHIPAWLVLASDVMMLSGYVLFIRTMLYNEYASRTIEIQKDQKLISTGPYAVVRHPMYAAGLLMYIFMPLALGSVWAYIPLAFFPLMLAFRLLDEEKALIKDLEGYKQYMKKVKYRLVPWVW